MHTCIIICILIFLLIYTFLNSRCRNVRKADRDLNKDSYPFLNFPEIYVMHNGFKDFYETHQVNSVVKLSKTYFCQNNGLDIHLCRLLYIQMQFEMSEYCRKTDFKCSYHAWFYRYFL